MRHPLKLAAIAALLAGLSLPVQGQGVPTIDVTSIAKLMDQLVEAKAQLREMIEQNLKLDDQTAKMLQQIVLLQDQIDALRKGLTLADLGIDPDSFLQEILPEYYDLTGALRAARRGDWGAVLARGDSFRTGGRSVSDHADAVFEAAGISRQRVDELVGSEDSAAARIGQSANISVFMSVAAESSAEAAAESLTRIDGFVQQIPETAGLKEAIDLNTRVTAELGIALANVWSMEAIQTVSLGEMGVMDAATAADEEKYLRVKLSGDR